MKRDIEAENIIAWCPQISSASPWPVLGVWHVNTVYPSHI